MNKTLSVTLSSLAILGALGSGAAYYIVHEDQIGNAIEKTAWLDADGPLNDANDKAKEADPKKADKDFVAKVAEGEKLTATSTVFTDRVERLPGVYDVILTKRKVITEHLGTIAARDATITEHLGTIAARDNTITQLETEKANLTRERDELRANLGSAKSQVAQLETEKTNLQADNQRLMTDMKDETKFKTREQFDVEVRGRELKEQELIVTSKRYRQLWNWTEANTTGVKPPFPVNVIDPTGWKTDNTPRPKEAIQRTTTSIVTYDLRKGVLVVSVGFTTKQIKKGNIYEFVNNDGTVIGKIRLSVVEANQSVGEILPGTTTSLLARGATIHLAPAQAVSAAAGAAAAAATPAPELAPAIPVPVAAPEPAPTAPEEATILAPE
jgi:hypothetical protein